MNVFSGALYCCDPVMGDVGRGIFVREGIPEFLRNRALPAADIITPNQFELELLTGIKTRTLEDAIAGAKAAHKLGPKIVLVTSLPWTPRQTAPATPWPHCFWGISSNMQACRRRFSGHLLRSTASLIKPRPQPAASCSWSPHRTPSMGKAAR